MDSWPKSGDVFEVEYPFTKQLADVEDGVSRHYSKDGFVYKYPTKSGTHILVKPFNKSLLSDSQRARLQENPLMLWGY